ncbi:Threonyl/alanyl tRNA synthetase SAD [Penicillium freii]|nr:Threonyl/alanyl tRNA synthetase SAD [Penicillium freii]
MPKSTQIRILPSLGDFQKGECKPLKVFNSLSDGDTEAAGDGYQGSEAEDNEVANPDDEEDGGGRDLGSESGDEADEADDAEDGEDEEGEKDGDHSSESEYDEVENSEYVEPTGELAVSWLGSPAKNQKTLRESKTHKILLPCAPIAGSRTLVAQSEGLLHLGLKCPGPERVVDGFVMGTQVCPHSAIISFETGVFYRNRATDHIGLKNRGAPCNGRFMFNEFLRGYFTQDGKLDAKKVIGKLQEAGISNKTMFLSWALRCFDLSLLRNWLEQEGFDDVLPGDDNVCLVLNEFRANVKRVIGTTCYNGKRFPLNLPTAFLVLFGENHPLSGRNHHALVDSRQLALMARAFIELCKPPREAGSLPGMGSHDAGLCEEATING